MARTVGSAADDTRRRILDAATALFNERGYAGTSIRDITERLGMTKGALYYHFASKDELLHAMVAPLLDAVRAFLDGVPDGGTARPQDVRALVDLLDANAPLVRSLASDLSAGEMRTRLNGTIVDEATARRLVARARQKGWWRACRPDGVTAARTGIPPTPQDRQAKTPV